MRTRRIRSSRIGWWTPRVGWSVRSPAICVICRLRVVRRRRSAPMGWICCAGSGSCGRSTSVGIERLSWRPGISAAGSRAATRLSARIGGRSVRIRRAASPGLLGRVPAGVRQPGVPNAVTGKPTPGLKYASSTVAHCETVLRSFYAFHLEAGSGPIVNPFPLVRGRRAGRANAHGNPMDPVKAERSGRYRPRVAVRIPRAIPDEKFDELFAALGSHRDRALVAFWVSTGARRRSCWGRPMPMPTRVSS